MADFYSKYSSALTPVEPVEEAPKTDFYTKYSGGTPAPEPIPDMELAPLDMSSSSLIYPIKEALDIEAPNMFEFSGQNIVQIADSPSLPKLVGEPKKVPVADDILGFLTQFSTGATSGFISSSANLGAGNPEMLHEAMMQKAENQMVELGALIEQERGRLIQGQMPAGISPTLGAGEFLSPTERRFLSQAKNPEIEKLELQYDQLREEFNAQRQERDNWQAIRKQMTEASQTGWLRPPENMNIGEYLGRIGGSAYTSLSLAMGAGPAAGLLLGEMQGMDSYFEARENGLPIEEAQRLFMMDTFMSALTEKIPLDYMKTVKVGAIEKFIKVGTVEALQEAVQGITSNWLNKEFWDENREWFDNIHEDILGGFMAGGGMSLVYTEAAKTDIALPQYIASDLKKQNEVSNTFEANEDGWRLKEGETLNRENLRDLIALNTGIEESQAELTLRVMVDQVARTKGLTSEEYLETSLADVVFDEKEFNKKLGESFALSQGSASPFQLKLSSMLQTGRSKLPVSTPLEGKAILSRIESMEGISTLEKEYFKGQGLEDFLNEGKKTPFEVSQWMEERAPKVEVKELYANEPVTKEEEELATLRHLYDTQDTDVTREVDALRELLVQRAEGDSSPNMDILIQGAEKRLAEVTKANGLEDIFADLVSYAEREASEELVSPRSSEESATARYPSVNPKLLSEMPGAVDLLVRIPTYVDSPAAKAGEIAPDAVGGQDLTPQKYLSPHYPKEGRNLIAHVRGYMEEKDGKKIFHVFEQQSDWAQEQRDSIKEGEVLLGEELGKTLGEVNFLGAKGILTKAGFTEKTVISGENLTELATALSELDVRGDILLNIYNELAAKTAVQYAIDNGADAIAYSDANTVMLTEGHDKYAEKEYSVSLPATVIVDRLESTRLPDSYARIRKLGGKSQLEIQFGDEVTREEINPENQYSLGRVRQAFMSISRMRGEGEEAGKEAFADLFPEATYSTKIDQEEGMKVNYDRKLPKILEKLTKSKAKWTDFGKHKNAQKSEVKSVMLPKDIAEELLQDLYDRYGSAHFARTPEGIKADFMTMEQATSVAKKTGGELLVNPPRDDLILKDYTGAFQTDIIARQYDLSKVKDQDEPFSLFQKGNSRIADPQVLHQFIGETAQRGSKGINSKYRQALQMEREGVPLEEIRNETGWFKLPNDNKWRLPLSDKGTDINHSLYEQMRRNPNMEVKLSDIYVPGEGVNILDLYGAELGNTKVKSKALQGKLGEYNPVTQTITISNNLYGDMRGDVVRHEVQHVIGDIEGFLYAGKPTEATGEVEYNAELGKKIDELQAEHAALVDQFIKLAPPPPRLDLRRDAKGRVPWAPAPVQKSEETLALQEKIAELRKTLNSLMDAQEIRNYKMKLGEVEAWSAEEHRKYTDDQLKALHPFPVREGTSFYSIDENSAKAIEGVDEAHGLFRQQSKGAVGMLEDGRYILGLFQTADVSTLIHEFAHIATPYLRETQAKALAEWADTDYNLVKKYLSNPKSLSKAEFEQIRKFEEKFAVGFEKYLRKGHAPVATLSRIFRSMKEWLSQIYVSARSGALRGVTIPANITAVYDSLLLDDAERFGGEITSASLEEPLKVRKVNGKAQIAFKVKGKAQRISVDNLVQGKPATKIQRAFFGSDVRWNSPFEPTGKAIQEEMRALRDTTLTEGQVAQMSKNELARVAKYLRIPGAVELLGEEKLRVLITTVVRNDILLQPKMARDLEEAETKARTLVDSAKLQPSRLKAYKESIQDAAAFYTLDLISRVENSGTVGEFGKITARDARLANDSTRKFIGRHNPQLNKILKMARGSLRNSKANAHLAELQEVVWDPDLRWGRSKFQLAVEDQMDLSELSLEAVALVNEFKKLVAETGADWEAQGMMTRNNDGEQVPFLANRSGSKLIRRFTQDMWRILTLENQQGELYRTELAEIMGLVHGDPTMFVKFKKRIDSIKKQVNNRHIAQETMRFFEKMPTHVKFANGVEMQLLHTDPSNVASRMVYEMGMRSGFVEQFGQEDKLVERYIDTFVRAGGRRVDIERLFRSLNGLPINQTTKVAPGSPLAEVIDAYEIYLNLWKPAKLGLAAWNNLFETPGKIPTYAGGRGYVKSLFKLMYDRAFSHEKLTELTAFLESLDALSTDVESLFLLSEGKLPKLRQAKKFTRIIGQKFSYANGMMQTARLNEFISGLAAEELNVRLLKGKGTVGDTERLRLLKFTESQIETLMNSRERTDLHDAVVSRSPAMTQGTNLLPSERSAFHNQAYAKDIIGFDGYMVNTLRRTFDVTKALYQPGKKRKLSQKAAAWKLFAQFIAGHAASGIVQQAVRQFIKFGPDAWMYADWDDEDDGIDIEDLAKMMGSGMLYAMWGGPAGYIADQFMERRGRLDANAMAAGTLPYNTIGEWVEAVGGWGRYKNLSEWDRLKKFVRSFTNITTPMMTFAACVGITAEDKKLSFAQSEYYKWMRENKVKFIEGGERIDISEEAGRTKQFKWNLAKAVNIMKKQGSLLDSKQAQTKEIKSLLAEALELKPDEISDKAQASRIASSIRSRKLMTRLSPKDKERFAKAVHPEVYRTLQEDWDGTLELWAMRVQKEYQFYLAEQKDK